MLIKLFLGFAIVAMPVIMPSCPRYDAVRRMSAESLTVQTKSLENKQALYVALFKLLNQQVVSANIMLDSETANQVRNRNAKLMLELSQATDDGQKQALIAAASKDIAFYASDTATKKQQILAHVTLVKEKFNEMQDLDTQQLAAYTELDRWVQLKKVDEVMAEDVLNKFKTTQAASNKATGNAANLLTNLTNIVGGKAQ